MPNSALFVAIACILFAGNVITGPVPRTNALLPQIHAPHTFPSAIFQAPDLTPPSHIDISPPDSISSDPTNLHHRRVLDSLERRDPIFGLVVRSPKGSSPLDPQFELKKHVEQEETIIFGPYMKHIETQFHITCDFLSSLGHQYGARQHNPLLQSIIDTANKIKQESDAGPTKYSREMIEVVNRLLDLYKHLNSLGPKENPLISTSSDVELKVKAFTNKISSNFSRWQAEEVELEPSIVEMMNGRAKLLNLSRGDPSYIQERQKAASIEPYAEYASKRSLVIPKAAEAATSFLQFLARIDDEVHGQGKKRKAQGDHEDAPTTQRHNSGFGGTSM